MTKQELVNQATELTVTYWTATGNFNENQQWKKKGLNKEFWRHTKKSLTNRITSLKDKIETL